MSEHVAQALRAPIKRKCALKWSPAVAGESGWSGSGSGSVRFTLVLLEVPSVSTGPHHVAPASNQSYIPTTDSFFVNLFTSAPQGLFVGIPDRICVTLGTSRDQLSQNSLRLSASRTAPTNAIFQTLVLGGGTES
jgi:hypothetical protein